MSYLERFKVQPGSRVKLQDIDPAFKDNYESHEAAEEEIAHYRKKLRELQDLLYAQQRQSLLICLQAVDTGGKDGTINHVLGAMNPQGCRVAAFRQPSAEERTGCPAAFLRIGTTASGWASAARASSLPSSFATRWRFI